MLEIELLVSRCKNEIYQPAIYEIGKRIINDIIDNGENYDKEIASLFINYTNYCLHLDYKVSDILYNIDKIRELDKRICEDFLIDNCIEDLEELNDLVEVVVSSRGYLKNINKLTSSDLLTTLGLKTIAFKLHSLIEKIVVVNDCLYDSVFKVCKKDIDDIEIYLYSGNEEYALSTDKEDIEYKEIVECMKKDYTFIKELV